MVVPTEFLDGDDLTKTSNVPMPQKVPVSFDKEGLIYITIIMMIIIILLSLL